MRVRVNRRSPRGPRDRPRERGLAGTYNETYVLDGVHCNPYTDELDLAVAYLSAMPQSEKKTQTKAEEATIEAN